MLRGSAARRSAWRTLGIRRPEVDDPWPEICARRRRRHPRRAKLRSPTWPRARRPAIVIPSRVPSTNSWRLPGSSASTRLAEMSTALARRRGPGTKLLTRARAGDPEGGEQWHDRGAAARAAEAIERDCQQFGDGHPNEDRGHHHCARPRRPSAATARWASTRSARPPDLHVVVALDDPTVPEWWPTSGCAVRHRLRRSPDGPLPVARPVTSARLAALHRGADILVFLDVDCIPAASMIGRYHHAARDPRTPGPAVRTRHLPAAARTRAATRWTNWPSRCNPHPARPAPADGDIVAEHRLRRCSGRCRSR